MKLRKRLSALLVPLLALVLAACGSSNSPSGAGASGSTSSSTPVYGGTVVHLINLVDDNWQQQESTSSWYDDQIWLAITDTLFYLDGKNKIEPDLAASYTRNAKSTVYTITLKKGVTFSDGTPVNSQIVIQNLNQFAFGVPSKGIPRDSRFPLSYEKAVPVNDLTFKVYFKSPFAAFIQSLAAVQVSILGAKTLNLNLQGQSNLSNVVGTGPFTVSDYQPGKSVTLARRDDYNWAPAGLNHTGKAYLQTVVFRQVPDASVRESALTSGQADSIHYFPPSDEDKLKSQGFQVFPQLYSGDAYGYKISTAALGMSDVRVRQAIQHAINREQLRDTVYSDNWTVPTTTVDPGVPGATDVSKYFAYDPTLSNKLLDQAGWKLGSDGYRHKNGQKLTLTYYPAYVVNTATAQAQLVAQQLKTVGIDLEIKNATQANYAALAAEPSTTLGDATATYTDISSQIYFYGKDYANGFHTNDPKLQKLFTEVTQEPNETKRLKYISDLQQYLVQQAYVIPLVNGIQAWAASPGLHGIEFSGLGRINFYGVWKG